MLLIALAVARPQWGQRRQVSDLQGSDAVRVVVLDVSQSMAAAGRGRRADRAGADRGRRISPLPARTGGEPDPGRGPAASACSTAPRPTSTPCATSWPAAASCPQRMDVNRALDLAAPHAGPDFRERPSPAGIGRGERFPAVQLGEGRLLAPARRHADPTRIHRPGPAAGEPGDSAGRGPLGRLARQHAQLDVEVGNYSPTARKVTVEVSVGDSSWRLTGTCPPGRTHHA